MNIIKPSRLPSLNARFPDSPILLSLFYNQTSNTTFIKKATLLYKYNSFRVEFPFNTAPNDFAPESPMLFSCLYLSC